MNGEAGQGSTKRLLGLFAHPDDEVFCVGGTFAQAAAAGAETMIVSFTRGEAGIIRHADIATRSSLGTVRSAELDAACGELGARHSYCLDFSDGHLETVDRDRLVEAAVKIIRSFRPAQVFSFDQTGAYGHPDHIVMSEVAAEACERAGDPRAFPDAGDPFFPDEFLQARFPQNDRLLLQLLVDWLSGLDDRFRGTEDFTNALLMFANGTSMLGYASDHLGVEWFPPGAFVIEQGEPASSLYLVLSGAIDVLVEGEDGVRKHVDEVGVGEFIGETGIATDGLRNAHCVAAAATACFVLSPTPRSNHAPRGAGAPAVTTEGATTETGGQGCDVDLEIDVSAAVPQKVRALAQHRSQYAIAPGLFPDAMLQELMGTEYFFRAWTARRSE